MSNNKYSSNILKYKSLCKHEAKRDFVFMIDLKSEFRTILPINKVLVRSEMTFTGEYDCLVIGSWQSDILINCQVCNLPESFNLKDEFKLNLVRAYNKKSNIDDWLVEENYWDIEEFFNNEIDINLPKQFIHDNCLNELKKYNNT